MDDLVLVEHCHAGIVRLTLNRPAGQNSLSTDLRDRVSDALDSLAADPAVKVVILTGAGGTFSAGFDLGGFAEAGNDEAFRTRLWASSDRYHRALLHFPLPLLSAVNGAAPGADAIESEVRAAISFRSTLERCPYAGQAPAQAHQAAALHLQH